MNETSPPEPVPQGSVASPAFDGRHVHMIGIGGCGMSGAAAMLRCLGSQVSGSDLERFPGIGALVRRGVRVALGHHADRVHPETEQVVISAAIPQDNCELVEARRRGIPVIKYAELLGALMQYHRGVAITGTHGKTTTTAMAAWLFREAGLRPSFIFGADSRQLGGSSGVGEGGHFVVEACEFDRSFLHLAPQSAAILNVEPDHLDCYGSFDEIVGAFSQFAGLVAPDGLLVVNADDQWSVRAGDSARCEVQSFGFGPDAHWRAVRLEQQEQGYGFDVEFRGQKLIATSLSIPGKHNVANVLAAIALAYHAGADCEKLAKAITSYKGVGRRLAHRGAGRGVTVVDDYAHHPTELRVTIEAARSRYKPRRTWVVFQPHQYARTYDFMDDFATSLSCVDEVIVPDIYAAREPGADPAAGSAELVARICRLGGRALHLPTLEAAADHVANNVRDGDLVLTMGAGDVWKVADELVKRICGSSADARCTRTADVVSPRRSGQVPLSAVQR